MKKKEKKGLLILIVLVIVVIGVVWFLTKQNNNEKEQETQNQVVEEFVQVLEDGTKLNTSTKLKEVKKVNGLEFSNIQLTNKNGQSVLLADVKNTTTSATEIMVVNITLLDKEGNTIVEVGGIVRPLEPGETSQFNTGMTLDYANAYDFKVTVK